MNTPAPFFSRSTALDVVQLPDFAHRLYDDLLQHSPSDEARQDARRFLDRQLQEAELLPCDMPAQPEHLMAWMRTRTLATTDAYGQYLQGRQQGKPRRYFSNRAHALYFIQHVAPTKLVDGAWLFGLLEHWRELSLRPLLRTYLEELGDGLPEQNHVVLYKKLLAVTECDDLQHLDDGYFAQGAQQLALGHLAADYLPEVLGYNLGYEQLPLHLLISSYELAELDIDPYYFQLHVTIDNASTGHAQKAVQAVLDNLPVLGDREAFYQRVKRGYQLNDVGIGSTAVIAEFDLDEQVYAMLERKRVVAGQVHSDYCKVQGRTINQWLAEPGQIPDFLQALQGLGWIRRHDDPHKSRFWQLLKGERAAMFGVFNGYELQLLHDWIAGDWLSPEPKRRIRSRPSMPAAGQRERLDEDTKVLRARLQALPEQQRPAALIKLMSPANHHTSGGLLATRLFNAYLD